MIRVLLAALLVAAAPAALADLYKCVDAKGKMQYSDQPLPGCKGVVKREAPRSHAKSPQPQPTAARFAEHNRVVAEHNAGCARARQAYSRGTDSDAVRETLRDCM